MQYFFYCRFWSPLHPFRVLEHIDDETSDVNFATETTHISFKGRISKVQKQCSIRRVQVEDTKGAIRIRIYRRRTDSTITFILTNYFLAWRNSIKLPRFCNVSWILELVPYLIISLLIIARSIRSTTLDTLVLIVDADSEEAHWEK